MKIKLSITDQIIILTTIIGLAIFLINFIIFFSNLLTIVSISFVLIGPVIVEYRKYHENKDIEERFPDFLRDVSINIKAGMTLPQAIESTRNTNYGALTPYVRKIANQVDWGVPFDEILKKFSDRSTVMIKRIVSTIIESHKGGGEIADILDDIGRSITEVNNLRKERMSGVYSQMVTGYIIFFVFVGVLVSLKKFLVPSLASFATPEFSFISTNVLSSLYSDIFQWLILIQGFFSGLVIGKMAEGRLIAGLKHCLILIFVGFAIFITI